MGKGKNKRKTDEELEDELLADLLPAEPPPVEEPEDVGEAEETPVKDQDDKPYVVLEYAGRPLYRCKQCAYDAFNTEVVLEHIQKKHRPQPAEPSVLVATRSGKPKR